MAEDTGLAGGERGMTYYEGIAIGLGVVLVRRE